MPSLDLLLLPLLGGFIFVTHWHPTKYSALRSADYRLFFMAAIAGTIFLFMAAASVYYVGPSALGTKISAYWKELVPFKHSGTAAISFFIGGILWVPMNWLGRVPWVKRLLGDQAAVDRAIERKQDALELLLRQSLGTGQTIAVTLKNGKVYIGNLTTNLNPAFRTESIHLLLHRSGHRDPSTQKLVLDVDYDKTHNEIQTSLRNEFITRIRESLERDPYMNLDVFRKIKEKLDEESRLRNYEIAILISEVVSANAFDIELYDKHFREENRKEDEPPLPF